jgi:hypothetical protein
VKTKFWLLYIAWLFLVTEASLQLFYRYTTGTYLYVRDKPPLYASDPYSGWTNRPYLSYHHVTPEFTADIYTNREGFRVSAAHEEYEKQRTKNTFRILLLGPSFAFGWGVDYEDTFGSRLQQILNADQFVEGSKIEVLNHGVPGLPGANELEWLKEVGKDYSPNLVIHFVYGSLEVSPMPDNSQIVRSGHVIAADTEGNGSIWRYAKNSATVFYVGIIISQSYKIVFGKLPHGTIEGAGREMSNRGKFKADDSHIADSLRFYRSLQEAVEKAGANLLIVHFPLAYVVHPEDRLRWVLQGVENIEGQIDFNRTFAAYLNQIGIRCVNLTDHFIQSATIEEERLYYWLDVHWTERGNALAARVVADELIERRVSD